MAAIRELPEPQQQVVYYRYVQDFSVRMVANITNLVLSASNIPGLMVYEYDFNFRIATIS